MYYAWLIPFLIGLLLITGCAPLGECIDWRVEPVIHSARIVGDAYPIVTWTEPGLVCVERAEVIE